MEGEALLERAAGRFVPVSRVIGRAPHSPDVLLERLAGPGVECALLESADTVAASGRYSFVASRPASRLLLRDGAVVQESSRGTVSRGISLPRALAAASVRDGCATDPGLPPFVSGAVGYLAYDAVRQFESVPDRHPRTSALPDALFLLFDAVLAVDHERGELVALTTLDARDPSSRREEAHAASGRLDRLAASLGSQGALRGAPAGAGARSRPQPVAPADDFLAAVARAQEAILEGDAYQIVLSRRWEGAAPDAPLEAYRALRALNPSPYMFYFQAREGTIFGASPEMLVRCRGRRAQTQPIAGTATRGATPDEDRALAARLAADPKERAEHVMLVDLARNDLGRVCETGSVRVTRYAAIERYSHVQHLVSDVEGTLATGRDAMDALAACFPAGTLTGAPKIRAMELIDALEPSRRGVYGGAIGYLAATGDLDMAIAIRTAVVEGGTVSVQAGAGIVADSVPERELEETEAKATAVLRALEQPGDAPRSRSAATRPVPSP